MFAHTLHQRRIRQQAQSFTILLSDEVGRNHNHVDFCSLATLTATAIQGKQIKMLIFTIVCSIFII